MKGTTRSYLSVSQIRKYMNCGMQYYYRYVEGMSEKMGSAVLRGSSVDNAANEHFLKQAVTNQGLTELLNLLQLTSKNLVVCLRLKMSK